GPAADLSDVPADRVSEPHPAIALKPGLGLVKNSERNPLPLSRPGRRSYRFKPPGPTDKIDPGAAEVDAPLSAHLRPVIERVKQPNQDVISLVFGHRRDLNPRVVVGATDRLPGLIPPGEHDRADQLGVPNVRALRGLPDTLRAPDRSPTNNPAAGHRVELIVGDQPVLLLRSELDPEVTFNEQTDPVAERADLARPCRAEHDQPAALRRHRSGMITSPPLPSGSDRSPSPGTSAIFHRSCAIAFGDNPSRSSSCRISGSNFTSPVSSNRSSSCARRATVTSEPSGQAAACGVCQAHRHHARPTLPSWTNDGGRGIGPCRPSAGSTVVGIVGAFRRRRVG